MKDQQDSDENASFNKAKHILENYLSLSKLRKTPERFSILKFIYSVDGHFDIEALLNQMKIKGISVSKATLYNSMELFLQCNLVTKHQFGHNCAHYEKKTNLQTHDHAICLKCNKIIEFRDSKIFDIEKSLNKDFNFESNNHSLIFYGYCENCRKKD